MQKIQFSIDDMDCKSCAKVIIRKLSELEGVGDVTVDLDGKRVTVDFESHKVCDSDITCAVEALGYKVHTV